MPFGDHTLEQLRNLADLTVLVAAASNAGVFTELGRSPATSDELAGRLGFDPRATRIILSALAEGGLLEREGPRFVPSERCRAELCEPEGGRYLGGGLPLWLESIRGWTRLGEVLERGGPLEPREQRRRTPEGVARFMAGMAAAPRARVERIVDLCLERRPGAGSMLDIGGGPGHMTRAFVTKGLEGTLFDTSEILEHVRPAYGLDEVAGLHFVAGDFTTDPLPEGPFDVVLISNVLHMYGPAANRDLLKRMAHVTRDGGVVAIGEFLRGRSGRAARFGVQMLLHTERGDAYAEEDIGEWLAEAGFTDLRTDDLDPDRQLVSAIRA